jgi:hypothetical protein
VALLEKRLKTVRKEDSIKARDGRLEALMAQLGEDES